MNIRCLNYEYTYIEAETLKLNYTYNTQYTN